MNQTKAILSTALAPQAVKVLRNTYMLLALTLTFSAVTAWISVAVGIGRGASLLMSLGALGLIWFAISFLVDLVMFSSGPMKMPFTDYLADVGIVYVMIPIITVGFAGSLCGRTLN